MKAIEEINTVFGLFVSLAFILSAVTATGGHFLIPACQPCLPINMLLMTIFHFFFPYVQLSLSFFTCVHTFDLLTGASLHCVFCFLD